MSQIQHVPIGELLVEHGGLSEEHLRAALEEQRASGRPLGEIVVERGYVPAAMVAQALATQHGGLTKTEYGYATGWAQAIDERDRAIADLRRWAEQAHAAIAARDAEIERLGGELAAAQAGGGDDDELRAQVTTLQSELDAANARADEAEGRVPVLQQDLAELRRELEVESERAASRDAEIERLGGELAAAQAGPGDDDELRAQVTTLQSELDAANARADEAEGRVPPLQQDVAGLRRELEVESARAAALATEMDEAEKLLQGLRARAAAAEERADEAERAAGELRGAAAVRRDPWAGAGSHLLFVRRAAGYELVERDGPPPGQGELVDGATVQRVAALGGTPCAYLID